MNNFKNLVIELYEARRQNDEEAIRRLLAEDVVWHEPEVNESTGDLHGVDAVLRMIREALALTGGTFSLEVADVLENKSHAVALINWTAKKNGQTLEGSEFAVFKIESAKIKEVWFFQQDMNMDRAFWGVNEMPQ